MKASYIVATASSINELVDEVQKRIGQGFRPIGSICTYQTSLGQRFMQALTGFDAPPATPPQ